MPCIRDLLKSHPRVQKSMSLTQVMINLLAMIDLLSLVYTAMVIGREQQG